MSHFGNLSSKIIRSNLREGFKKSKWKFKMVFAMRGGGGSRGGLECHIPIFKNDFLAVQDSSIGDIVSPSVINSDF